MPPEIPSGEHEVMIALATVPARQQPQQAFDVDKLPIVDLDTWPEDGSFRREDLYGDDCR